MAVTEAAKHDLYTHLQQTMGDERADTLMAMVSPTGWEDVATKQDLALLRTEMTGEFKQVRTEMKNMQNEMNATLYRTLRTHMMATFGFFGIFMSLAVTLVR